MLVGPQDSPSRVLSNLTSNRLSSENAVSWLIPVTRSHSKFSIFICLATIQHCQPFLSRGWQIFTKFCMHPPRHWSLCGAAAIVDEGGRCGKHLWCTTLNVSQSWRHMSLFLPEFWAFATICTIPKANSTWGMCSKHYDTSQGESWFAWDIQGAIVLDSACPSEG